MKQQSERLFVKQNTLKVKQTSYKMNLALKEANETLYWLMLLKDSSYIDSITFNSIYPLSEELAKLLASIVKTTKNNLNK